MLFEKSRRAKRVIISIRVSKGARVAVPIRTSFKKAIEFVFLKKEWIQKHLVKIGENENREEAFTGYPLVTDKAAKRKRLITRLYHLAEAYGFACNNVSIREQKTRWGSCSHKNNISLNLKLAFLPKELIDYVMLHELVHTRIHNHSRAFWAELDTYVGDGKAMSKRLRAIGLRS
ncbi:M48 family metallopeptidase [Chloroflexota bacterium]